MDILDSLGLKVHYDTYEREPQVPWPHRYVVQDIVQAFVTMALFFCGGEAGVAPVGFIRDHLSLPENAHWKSSLLFDPSKRATAGRPNVRTRNSLHERPASFWSEWESMRDENVEDPNKIPIEWGVAIRPIIAKRKYL